MIGAADSCVIRLCTIWPMARRVGAAASVMFVACGRLRFDQVDNADARRADSGADADPAPCVAIAAVDWTIGAMPNEPASGLPHGAAYAISADQSVVTDQVSGLLWQRAADQGLYTLDQATAYCASLALGGCAQWRVPQRIELQSLVEQQPSGPTIDIAAFTGTATDALFWAATQQATTANNVWAVNFVNGNAFPGQPITTQQHVRCVRSLALAASPPARYQTSIDTVADLATQLTWQRAVDLSTYTWSQADAYCAGLGIAGGGWRLPSIGELETIIDATKSLPSIDPSVFPSTPTTPFWSATQLGGVTGTRMVVVFDQGPTNNRAEATPAYVRCVR
jgi:hypothetical protein